MARRADNLSRARSRSATREATAEPAGGTAGMHPRGDGASSEAWTQVQGPRGAERGAGNPAYPALLSAQGKRHRKSTERNSSHTGTKPRSSPTQADWNSVGTVFLADFNTRGLQFPAA